MLGSLRAQKQPPQKVKEGSRVLPESLLHSRACVG